MRRWAVPQAMLLVYSGCAGAGRRGVRTVCRWKASSSSARQIVALDNAKSFRCHAFGNGLGAQRKQVEHFWRNWSHFGNQPIIAKLRALKREGRTLSSLLLARNPQLIPHRKMLAEMDHRARVVLHVVEATSTHSQLAELP